MEHAGASHTATVVFALALIVLGAYGKSLDNGFVFDDAVLIERDARLQPPIQWQKLATKPLWIVPHGGGGLSADKAQQLYRPLQLVPLAVSKAWFDGSALPCHLLNLALHFVNSLLVYALLRRLLVTPVPALLLSALFAAHPGLSESVLWVSGVSGLGAACATLGLVVVHARKRPSAMGAMLLAALYLAGMGFSEVAVLAPLLLVAFDLVGRRCLDSSARTTPWADYGFLLPALSIYLTLRHYALGSLLPTMPVTALTPTELGINAVALLPKYVGAYLSAFDLHVYHDFATIGAIDDPRFQTGMLVLGACALIFLGTVRDRPATAFGIAFAALTVAPHLIVRWPWIDAFSERYTYLPAAGVVLTCGGLLQLTQEPRGWERWTRALAGASVAVLIPLFVWVGFERSRDWQSEHVVAAKDGGATGTESEQQKAIHLQVEMLAKNPNYPQAWHNLGLLYLDAERPLDALGAFREADRREPGRILTLLKLGGAYELAGQRERAIETYFRALQAQPKTVEARYRLAVIAYESGQGANAREVLADLLRLSPKHAEASQLKAKVDAATGRPIAETAPASATHRRCEDASRLARAGKTAEAIAKLRAAAWLDERSSLPHHYLANLYYRDGRLDAAIAAAKKAVALAPDNSIYRDNLTLLESARDDRRAKLDSRAAVGN